MIENIATTDSLVLVAILAAFIIIGYKVLTILRNALIIAVLAAVFPYVLNYFFGAHFSTAYAAEMQYLIIALGLYLVYEAFVLILGLGGFFWSILKLLSMPFVWLGAIVKRMLYGKQEQKKGKKKNDEE